ncbi:GNAT family N-acetyltransferase [Aliikangiella sp. IMCC44359]|uniref:GNAT family N-acetyltransferase n=1 Tax=Aliikangiella sp. IMCC44359 TaxID=3459125 RepID=UPI00403AAE30
MYEILEKIVSVNDFMRLREATGLTPRSRAGAEVGLPNSLYGVHIKIDSQTIAMGRVVGDGGLNFEIVDVAVEPKYQGQGIGRIVMEHIMAYLEQTAPKDSYITLMADVPELYQKFGFKYTSPECEGMYINR